MLFVFCVWFLKLSQLAGIKMEVVKTNKAGHARELASTVDISLCSDGIYAWFFTEWYCLHISASDMRNPSYISTITYEILVILPGIICVGGDGIINEVW